jgi:hypothetical protein
LGEIKVNSMNFLCSVNPRPGKEQAVIKLIKENFGGDTNIDFLEEDADLYVVRDASIDTLEKLRTIQADADVIDTQVEVILTRELPKKETKSDRVYLALIDTTAGRTDEFIAALKSEVNRVAAGVIEVLYIGEVFSLRADVVLMLGTNIASISEVGDRIRSLPGVDDTIIYCLRARRGKDR